MKKLEISTILNASMELRIQQEKRSHYNYYLNKIYFTHISFCLVYNVSLNLLCKSAIKEKKAINYLIFQTASHIVNHMLFRDFEKFL